MKSRRASVLIISLWVMAILVVFALSVAHRVSINLRLAKYQMNRLKAVQLAQAGVNKAIMQVGLTSTDSPTTLGDPWSTGVDPNLFGKINVFENVTLRDTAKGSGLANETFSVHYARPLDFGIGVESRCMDDEEGKININALTTPVRKAAFEMLLVDEVGMVRDEAAEFRRLLAQWIGDPTAEALTITVDTTFYKYEALRAPEELLLVLECFFQAQATADKPHIKAQEAYAKLKGYITVYGDGNININTVPRPVLAEFCNAAVEAVQNDTSVVPPEGTDAAVAQEVCNDLIELRGPALFAPGDLQDVSTMILSINNAAKIAALGSPDVDAKSAVLAKFFPYNDTSGVNTTVGNDTTVNTTTGTLPGTLSAKSTNFRICSIGRADTVTRTITVVYDRSSIVYWHEQ